MKDKTPRPDLEQLLNEHFRLRELLSEVSAAANRHSDRQAIVGKLHELRDRVRQHFALEEQGGYLHQALDDAEHLQHAARQLQNQHPVLLQQLNDLIASGAEPPGAVVDQSFADRFQTFATQFEEHEHGEYRLVQSASNEKLGAAD